MNQPIVISENNLSNAWAKSFLSIINGSNNCHPLLVSLSGFENGTIVENEEIRNAVNSELISREKNPIDVSAMVIFPYKVWLRRGQPSCKEFSKWCINKYIPRLKARDKRNCRGLYFERMINYCYYNAKNELTVHDQLLYIVDWWKETKENGRRPRRSGLQVACFDPRLDHIKAPRLGFPCLQQIGFTYNENGLIVNAFYPTQFIFDRAYGNYLGLCHLGIFMAHEMQVKLVQVNCFIGCAQIGTDVNKRELQKLIDFLKNKTTFLEG